MKISILFSALCTGGCRNGGKCVAPNQCSCKKGYEGKNCKKGKNQINDHASVNMSKSRCSIFSCL